MVFSMSSHLLDHPLCNTAKPTPPFDYSITTSDASLQPPHPVAERDNTHVIAFPPADTETDGPCKRENGGQTNSIRILPRPRLLVLSVMVSHEEILLRIIQSLTPISPTLSLSDRWPFSRSPGCETALIDLISTEKSPSWDPKKLIART